MQKTCSKCRVEKDLLEFSPATTAKDGISCQCKACRNAWKAARPAEVKRAERLAYKQRHPEKHRAQKAVRKAVARGTLVRPEACEGCGAGGPVQAHHEDYTKRFEVVWLCPSCHGLRHSEDFEWAA